jgi:hypothetical protein
MVGVCTPFCYGNLSLLTPEQLGISSFKLADFTMEIMPITPDVQTQWGHCEIGDLAIRSEFPLTYLHQLRVSISPHYIFLHGWIQSGLPHFYPP